MKAYVRTNGKKYWDGYKWDSLNNCLLYRTKKNALGEDLWGMSDKTFIIGTVEVNMVKE